MKDHSRFYSLAAALGALAVCLPLVCCQVLRMPVLDGAVMEIRRSDQEVRRGEPGWGEALQLEWFGTSCHVLRLGEVSVLLDPFVTNGLSLTRLESNPQRVAATLGRIAVPDVVLVNHSHHDHMLDAFAVLSLPAWKAQGVRMWGGQSLKHLMAGWGDAEVLGRCEVVADNGGPVPVQVRRGGYRVKVTAFRSEHSPHTKCGLTLGKGPVRKPLKSPPRGLLDFKAGEVFNYLIELSGPSRTWRVFFLGAPYDLGDLPGSVPLLGTEVDVAILMAPSAKNVEGYPAEHLKHLRPKHIVISHFNTFAKEAPDEQAALLGIPVVDLPKLSRDVQGTFVKNAGDYPGFEKLYVPAITTFDETGRAGNVIVLR